jgi:hypothetical protein
MENEEIALKFVNSLVPGKFDIAKELLSHDCRYQYGIRFLRAMHVQSFINNHNYAITNSIQLYIDGIIDSMKKTCLLSL